jgi:hypothetical protein
MKTTATITAGLLLICIAATVWWRQRESDRAAGERGDLSPAEVQPSAPGLSQPGNQQRAVTEKAAAAVQASVPSPLSTSAPPPVAQPAPSPAMLQDPETRALMRKQQEREFTKLADKIVTKDFARNWGLSDGQTVRVKDVVREKAMAGKDLLNAMLFDGLDDAALAQRGRETKQRLADADDSLRTLLGSDGFDALKQQERMLEIRERVKQIRDEFAAGDQTLTQAQQDSLIEAMFSERQAFSFRVDYEDPAKFDFERIRDVFSEANLQIYFEDLQQLNARVAERAALFLSPAQLDQIRNLQQNQLERARLTTKVTTELFNRRHSN